MASEHVEASKLEPGQQCTTGKRFTGDERRRLLAIPGIGQGVISRLEHAGVHSLHQLNNRGIDAMVDQICQAFGNLAWRNRKRALSRALAELKSHNSDFAQGT